MLHVVKDPLCVDPEASGPHVYVHCHITQPYPVLRLDKLQKVFTFNWTAKAERAGIPDELIVKVYDDFDGLSVNNTHHSGKTTNVLYVGVEEVGELQNLVYV